MRVHEALENRSEYCRENAVVVLAPTDDGYSHVRRETFFRCRRQQLLRTNHGENRGSINDVKIESYGPVGLIDRCAKWQASKPRIKIRIKSREFRELGIRALGLRAGVIRSNDNNRDRAEPPSKRRRYPTSASIASSMIQLSLFFLLLLLCRIVDLITANRRPKMPCELELHFTPYMSSVVCTLYSVILCIY